MTDREANGFGSLSCLGCRFAEWREGKTRWYHDGDGKCTYEFAPPSFRFQGRGGLYTNIYRDKDLPRPCRFKEVAP